jgi:hypothetical protein
MDDVMYEMGKWDGIAGHPAQHPEDDDYMVGYMEGSV